MHMTEEQQLIDEIRRLVKVPPVYTYLSHKLCELKHMFREDIANYYEICSMVEDSKEPRIARGEKFVIFRGSGGEWQAPIDIDVPRQLLDYIGDQELMEKIPFMVRDLKLPGLTGRTYDLLIEKLDGENISVVLNVFEDLPPGAEEPVVDEWDENGEELKNFLGCLASNKMFRDHIVAQFQDKWRWALACEVTDHI
jgi:hypothetical protein